MDNIFKMNVSEECVYISGNFNVIHSGHLRLFSFAKECAPILVVGVNSDSRAKAGALVCQADRLQGVIANSYVDHAFIQQEPTEKIVGNLKPKYVIKGKEHEGKINPEKKILEQYGGKLLFCSGEANYSSEVLLNSEITQIDSDAITHGLAYMDRHNIKLNNLYKLANSFKSKKVCVVGDLIMDEYIVCEAQGLSREEPVMVVSPREGKKFIGGGAIVAGHALGFGANVEYFGVRGDDEHGRLAEKKLNGMGLNFCVLADSSRPTTLKTRYRVDNKSVLRVNHFRKHAISKEIQDELFSRLKTELAQSDLLIMSDFNYGLFPDEFVERLTSEARKSGVFIAADSQCSSQIGNVKRFKGVDILTPTEHEARVSLQDPDSGLVVLSEKMQEVTGVPHIVLTLNKEGILIQSEPQDAWNTDKLPAFTNNPLDTSGAGDCLLVTVALAMKSGGSIWQAALLGSIAAKIQVSKLGNDPIRLNELIDNLVCLS